MDAIFNPIITRLAEQGPGFVMAAVIGVFYYFERKRNTQLVDRLYRLSVASLKADHAHTKMYNSINRALTVLVDMMRKNG